MNLLCGLGRHKWEYLYTIHGDQCKDPGVRRVESQCAKCGEYRRHQGKEFRQAVALLRDTHDRSA